MDVSQRLPVKNRVKTGESVSSKRTALPASACRDGLDRHAVLRWQKYSTDLDDVWKEQNDNNKIIKGCWDACYCTWGWHCHAQNSSVRQSKVRKFNPSRNDPVQEKDAFRPDVYWRKGRQTVPTGEGKFRIVDGGSLQVLLLISFLLFPFFFVHFPSADSWHLVNLF